MNQKVVLITGCSSGIGLALAVRIAKDEKKRFMGKVHLYKCNHCSYVTYEAIAFLSVEDKLQFMSVLAMLEVIDLI